jgi:glucose-1-phosphate thymidylyltransferase
MAGVLAVGGEGTRYRPNLFKHLDSLYDKPALYYLVAQLMQAGIRDIIVVCSPSSLTDTTSMVRELETTCGSSFSVCVAHEPNGPAGVFRLAEVREFIRNRPSALMLDGIYYGGAFDAKVALGGQTTEGCTILAKRVSDPTPFGWLREEEGSGAIAEIVEKPRLAPEHSKKYLVQTHLYFYGPDLIDRAERVRKSPNGEYGVAELHDLYRRDGKLSVLDVGESGVWDDAGTPEKRRVLVDKIAAIQEALDIVVGSPHLVAHSRGWVDEAILRATATAGAKSEYWRRVLRILDRSPQRTIDNRAS